MEAMRKAGDAASNAHIQSSPGFTAINQCPPQLTPPPQPSAVSQTQQNQTKVRTTGKSSRRRNPTVASYLGLDHSTEPAHLVKYAPTSNGQPSQPMRKRRVPRNGDKTSTKKANTDSRKASNQRRVSENPRVTKQLNQSVIYKLDGSIEEPLPIPSATDPAAERQRTDHQRLVLRDIDAGSSTAPPNETFETHAIVSADDGDDDFGQLCFDFGPNAHTADDSIRSTHTSMPTEHLEMQHNEDDFDDDLMDNDLLDLTTDTFDVSSSPQSQSSSPVKIDVLDETPRQTQTPGTSTDTIVLLDEEVNSSCPPPKTFVSPVTLTTRLLAATGEEARKPIVRPPFPAAVRDRSPIIGLSSNTLLRSCFRVGEAINQSCQAVKTGNNILVELYARVLNSERDDLQQRFTFCDLFHAKPPYIQATYAAAIWKTVQLFEYDSARLLQQGSICRCMGTMKRNGKNWIMTVLNIWEATWDDVQWVEGIVNS